MSTVAEAKTALRSEVRARIAAIPEENRASESVEVVRHVVADAATGAYVVKRVLSAADLRPGRFGVLEPGAECPVVPFSALDLVLVPGIAFDRAGNRLGRGRGFYDRMLALSPDAVSCGVGFDGQVVARVPVEPHDVKLHRMWTPTGQILAGSAPS